ncbi:MAG: inorganic phosphate transporter [Bacteroidota bacterium]
MLTLVIITIAIALLFDLLNGMNDAGNSIATIVATRVLPPKLAVLWAAFFNFIAFLVFGVHVASTIGNGIIHPEVLKGDPYCVLAALMGAILWVWFCQRNGLPNSVSHALIGGLIGPALIKGGLSAVFLPGLIKIAIFIVLAPLLGFIIGYFFMILTMLIWGKVPPAKVDRFYRIMQLVSSAGFSLGHGGNDAQKTMGIIAALLFSTGYLTGAFYVPLWVVLSAHLCIALGTLFGAWKVIKTLGHGLTNLKPVHGFVAETSGALTLFGATMLGIPVSTTHTITGAIMGVGVTRRFSAVKWEVAGSIITAWILTIPMTILFSAGIYWMIKLIF